MSNPRSPGSHPVANLYPSSGGEVDLSLYYTSAEVDTLLAGYMDLISAQSASGVKDFTNGIKAGGSTAVVLKKFGTLYTQLSGISSTSPAEVYIGSNTDPKIYVRADQVNFEARDGTYTNCYISNAEVAPYTDNNMKLGTSSLHWKQLYCGRGYFKDYGSDPGSGTYMRVRHDATNGFLESYDFGSAVFRGMKLRASLWTFTDGTTDVMEVGATGGLIKTAIGISTLYGTTSRLDIGSGNTAYPGIYGNSSGEIVFNGDLHRFFSKSIGAEWARISGLGTLVLYSSTGSTQLKSLNNSYYGSIELNGYNNDYTGVNFVDGFHNPVLMIKNSVSLNGIYINTDTAWQWYCVGSGASAQWYLGNSANVTLQRSGDYLVLTSMHATTPTTIQMGSNADPSIYHSATTHYFRTQAGTTRWNFTTGATPTLLANSVQVLTVRQTGWNAPTGTLTRGTFAATATLATTAQTLAALITDLRTHGLIST